MKYQRLRVRNTDVKVKTGSAAALGLGALGALMNHVSRCYYGVEVQ